MGTTSAQQWRSRLALALIIVIVAVIVFLGAREIISLKDRFTLMHTVAVTSPVDERTYEVHDTYPDTAAAADMLARINKRVIEIMRHLKSTYIKDAAPDIALRYPERVKAVQRLLARYNPDNLAENSPFDPEGDSAYSLDKGALVALCLRDRHPRPKDKDKFRRHGEQIEEGRLHSIDTILFVTIHEMSHIAIDAVDHPKEFWSAFKFLLYETEKAGIARFPNYRDEPVNYCGVLVDYNPEFDRNLSILQ